MLELSLHMSATHTRTLMFHQSRAARWGPFPKASSPIHCRRTITSARSSPCPARRVNSWMAWKRSAVTPAWSSRRTRSTSDASQVALQSLSWPLCGPAMFCLLCFATLRLILDLIPQWQNRRSIPWCSANHGRSPSGANVFANCPSSAGAAKNGQFGWRNCNASFTAFRLCPSHQIVSQSVRHLRHARQVHASERVPNARSAVRGQELQHRRGRHLRVARARQHHGLHRLPHVGVLRRYGGSGGQTGAECLFALHLRS